MHRRRPTERSRVPRRAARAAPRRATSHERASAVSAAAVDGADKRLLAALFRALEASFGFGPADLGMLMVGQNLALALSAPVWGQLADASRDGGWMERAGCCAEMGG
mgnify:CR=1 FL=1